MVQLKQSRALFTTHDRVVVRTIQEEVVTEKVDDGIKKLLKLCDEQGWRLDTSSAGKVLAFPPDGKSHPVPISTRAYGRGLKNIEAALRRAGLKVPGKDEKKPTTQQVLVEAAQQAIDKADGKLGDVPPEGLVIVNTLGALRESFDEYGKDMVRSISEAVTEFTRRYITTASRAEDVIVDSAHALYCTKCSSDTGPDKVKELEKELLEQMEMAEAANRRADKSASELSRVGSELQTERQHRVVAEERAISAERKLAEISKRLEGIL